MEAIMSEKVTIWVIISIMTCILLVGCNSDQDDIEVKIDSAIQPLKLVEGWEDHFFIRNEDSLKSSFEAILAHYKVNDDIISTLDISTLDITRNMPYGTSYLRLLEKIEEQTGVYSTFVHLDYRQVIDELLANQPVISRRILRDDVFDYVVIIGYDLESDTLNGLTIYSKKPVEITEKMWEQDFQHLGLNWSIIASTDQNKIQRLKESSQPFWLQVAVDAISEHNYSKLEQAIDKITELKFVNDRVMLLKSFYHLIVKKDITDEVDRYITKLYEDNPILPYSNEYNFHKYRLLGDDESAMSYISNVEKNNQFGNLNSETIDILIQIYKEMDDIERAKELEDILKKNKY